MNKCDPEKWPVPRSPPRLPTQLSEMPIGGSAGAALRILGSRLGHRLSLLNHLWTLTNPGNAKRRDFASSEPSFAQHLRQSPDGPVGELAHLN